MDRLRALAARHGSRGEESGAGGPVLTGREGDWQQSWVRSLKAEEQDGRAREVLREFDSSQVQLESLILAQSER